MSKIKIFIPVHSKKKGNFIGEKKVIYNGLLNNKKVILTNRISNCDYIFLDFRDVNPIFIKFLRKYKLLRKTVMIDFRDGKDDVFPFPVLKYFKRSIVDKSDIRNLKIQKYRREIIPISYSIKEEILRMPEFKNIESNSRHIDISIFFQIKNPNRIYRDRVANFIKNNFSNLNIHVGVVGKIGENGRNTIQKAYYNKMLHSKIVVTCNPNNWEGDYRLFEALASGALVFVDKMKTPIKNPFINGEHLIYYDILNLEELKEKILYYLEHNEERKKIALNGNEYAKKYHMARNRVDEILSHLIK